MRKKVRGSITNVIEQCNCKEGMKGGQHVTALLEYERKKEQKVRHELCIVDSIEERGQVEGGRQQNKVYRKPKGDFFSTKRKEVTVHYRWGM